MSKFLYLFPVRWSCLQSPTLNIYCEWELEECPNTELWKMPLNTLCVRQSFKAFCPEWLHQLMSDRMFACLVVEEKNKVCQNPKLYLLYTTCLYSGYFSAVRESVKTAWSCWMWHLVSFHAVTSTLLLLPWLHDCSSDLQTVFDIISRSPGSEANHHSCLWTMIAVCTVQICNLRSVLTGNDISVELQPPKARALFFFFVVTFLEEGNPVSHMIVHHFLVSFPL